jgi:Holliday junction resolvasome RuvABC endonuclease subunit
VAGGEAVIALGIDVSTKKLAIAGIREDGSLVTKALELDPNARAARRLVGARLVAHAALGGHAGECCACIVENPLNRRPNMQLLGVAFVVIEAAQSAMPGAIVMDAHVGTWKKEALGDGHGGATKEEVMAHAIALGYEGQDQDIADALVMADCAWGRWNRATRTTQTAETNARSKAA